MAGLLRGRVKRCSIVRLGAYMLLLALVTTSCGGGKAVVAGGGRPGFVAERLVALPRTASEYEQVFHAQPSSPELSRLQKLIPQSESSGHILLPSVAGAEGTVAADVAARLATGNAALYTLIGHNEGGRFYFTDGSSLLLNDVRSNTGIVALVSCESARYANGSSVGITTSPTYSAALEIEQRFTANMQSLYQQGTVLTPQLAVAQMDQALASARRDGYVTNVARGGVAVGAGGISYGIYEIQS